MPAAVYVKALFVARGKKNFQSSAKIIDINGKMSNIA